MRDMDFVFFIVYFALVHSRIIHKVSKPTLGAPKKSFFPLLLDKVNSRRDQQRKCFFFRRIKGIVFIRVFFNIYFFAIASKT